MSNLERQKDEIMDANRVELDSSIKLAAAKASPSIVGILSHHLPDDMAHFTRRGRMFRMTERQIKVRGELVFWGSGIIYECYPDDESSLDSSFSSIIICAATLFFRTNDLDPSDVEVDVYLWDDRIYQGRVIACDFHNNLAAIRIQTPCPLQPAILKNLDDFVPINITPIQQQQQQQQQLPLLRPHSTKYNVSPGTHLFTIARSKRLFNGLLVRSGVFSPTTSRKRYDFSELYNVKKADHPEMKGGAVMNDQGEVVGLLFYKFSLLPINLVSAWWKNFKSCRQYHRPYLGMKIGNLHMSCSKYLREFLAVFSDVTGGAVVLEVAEDSQAYASGIRPEDVIVKCDGKLVRSSLELFEIVWNTIGIEYVELEVFRARNGDKLKLSLKVEQTSPDKMNQWELTSWGFFSPLGFKSSLFFSRWEARHNATK